MKKSFYLMLILIGIVACNPTDTTSEVDPDAVGTDTASAAVPQEPAEKPTPPTTPEEADVVGYYVGMFEAKLYDDKKKPSWSNRINVSVDSLRDGIIYGHSVVAGNSRPFSGGFTNEGAKYQVMAKEPGDDKYDGEFEFELDAEAGTVEGTWSANDKKLAVTVREYELKKTTFRYNPNQELGGLDYIGLYDTYDEETNESEYLTEASTSKNPSVDELNKADVENMNKGDLEVMRNGIYARHGYSFKNRRMRYIFDEMVEWYVPVSTDIRADLTELEKKNIDLIKRYEKHAERYYDSFGR